MSSNDSESSTSVHYFATSVFGWNVADSAAAAKKQRLWLDGEYTKQDWYQAAIVRVPLPKEAAYSIQLYMPQVDGAEVVEQIGDEPFIHFPKKS